MRCGRLGGGCGTLQTLKTGHETGQPQSSNVGRFQYTGQMWLPEAGLYYYRARFYNPRIGRFMQTDPIMYAGGANLYAYVANDPVNATDPLGLRKCAIDVGDGRSELVECGGDAPSPSPGFSSVTDFLAAWQFPDYLSYFLGPIGDPMLEYVVPRGYSGEGDADANTGDIDLGNLPVPCPVAQGEISIGIQGGARTRLGPVRVGAFADHLSFRYRLGSERNGFYATQSRTLQLSIPGQNWGVSEGREVQLRGQGREDTLSEQPIAPHAAPPFFGVDLQGAAIVGGAVRIGTEIHRGRCPGA